MIDSHLHVDYKGYSAERLHDYLKAEGLEAGWVLTWEERDGVAWHSIMLGAEAMWRACARYPKNLIPFYAPDPKRPDAVEAFRKAVELGVRGCGELKTSLHWSSPEVRALLEEVNHHRMPLVFHMEEPHVQIAGSLKGLDTMIAGMYLSESVAGRPFRLLLEWLTSNFDRWTQVRSRLIVNFPGYLPDFDGLEKVLVDFPEIKFVGHGPLFWKGISDPMGDGLKPQGPVRGNGITIRLLERHPNLFADLSGGSGYNALTRDPVFTPTFLTRFSKKLLFGSDNTGSGIRRYLQSLNLDPAVLKNIMSDNASHLVR